MGTDEEWTPRRQIELESRLAEKLLSASAAERRDLYGPLYDEKWASHLPQSGSTPLEQTRGAHPALLKELLRLTKVGSRVVEIGCGTGYLSLELARHHREVLATDVSSVAIAEALGHAARAAAGDRPAFQTGSALTLPANDASTDFAFSIEVVEHLHEQDVRAHFDEVRRILRPGGRYWFVTPNRLYSHPVHERYGIRNGSSDVLDIHLREWTYEELGRTLATAGFHSLRSPWRQRRLFWLPPLPLEAKIAAERLAFRLPRPVRRGLGVATGIIACSVIATRR